MTNTQNNDISIDNLNSINSNKNKIHAGNSNKMISKFKIEDDF